MKQIIFTIIIIVCCNSVFSQTDEKGIVLGIERSTADAFTKHNLTFLTSIFADNINVITATGEIVNKEQLLRSVQNVNSVTVSNMQVRIENNIAIVTGLAMETGKDDNGVYSNKLRFTDVLLRTKGQWQIIASQATAIQQ
jgi:hypothetical protein